MFLNKKRGLGSDIWSAGVIVYYLATQKLPFDSTEAILKLEPAPLPNTFTDEFKSIIFGMLNKNILFRPNAETILTKIFQDFPQIEISIAPKNIVLSRNAEPRSGILNYFTKVCYHDFLKLCRIETDSKYHEHSFQLFSNSDRDFVALENNAFSQITFHNNMIVVKSYSMQSGKGCFPVSWQLEGKNESDNWILIDKREKVQEMKEKDKLIVFTLQKEMMISSLRLTILDSTGKYGFCHLKSFELFGEITHKDSTLRELLTKQIKLDIVTLITFNFSITSHLGLFTFFSNVSLKDRNDVFEVYSSQTKPNSTSQNLLLWNDEEWQAESEDDISLFILFRFPFLLRLAG
jgi:serine/threonine protein kinase